MKGGLQPSKATPFLSATARPACLFFLLFSLLSFGCLSNVSDAYSVKEGKMSYPENRPLPAYNATVLNDTADFTLTKIQYQGHGAAVSALLRIPKNAARPPAVIILPGATIVKEGRQQLAERMREWGYASITLDVRGNGETKKYKGIEDDFQTFKEGKEPEEAQMVLDVLEAYDLLKAFPVDTEKVAVIGESMGGRYATIAAALEKKINGVLLVSSAGYGFPNGKTLEETAFLRLIDPDNYVLDITPRPVYAIHSPDDATVPFASAKRTFDRTGQPKELKEFTCSTGTHGWCPAMDGLIKGYLEKILR